MRSTLRRCPSGRAPALLIAVALGGLGACGSSEDVHEVLGGVQTWPGEIRQDAPARPAPSTIAVKPFKDDVGRRAATETRALITSAAGYLDYFGHAPPSEVDFKSEWVIFYAAGTQRSGGYRADVKSVAANGDALTAVTVLFTPGAGCVVTDALTSPYVLVKFAAQKTRGVIFQHSDQTVECAEPAPLPPGCAAILCPVGTTCALDKSKPPQAHCVPIDPAPGPGPAPSGCTSSEQCGKGQRCSTERGECLGCGSSSSMVSCPAVCFGVCELIPTPGPTCVSSVLMGGCRSEEAIKAEAADLCKRRGLTLTQFGVGNACFAGGFVEAKFTCCGPETMPPPPPPPPPCTGGVLMGNCRTAEAIKIEAAEICKRQNLVLTDFGVGNACFAGGFVEAKYACCGAEPPPPPPPPPMCTGGVLMGGCRSAEAIKVEAAEICKRQNLVLTDFGVGNACFAGGFVEAKYLCCGSQPPPPPPPVCKVDSDCALTSNYCGETPCTCQAGPRGGAPTPCTKPPVACLVDPCGGKVAACVAGQCTAQPGSITPQPPACTWDYMGGPTSCKPYDLWKQYASDTCKQKGQILNNISTGSMCEGGNFVEIKFECCPTR